MRIFKPVDFSVPFEDNDAAKSLGAKFNWDRRTWYAPSPEVADCMSQRWIATSNQTSTISSILYFDTETDGLGGFRPPTQRLVQLAWEYAGTEGDALINDVKSINPEVPHPHSVDDCERNGVSFMVAFAPFMDALRQCDIAIAHNLDFDRGVLLHELTQRGLDATEFSTLMDAKGYCTMKNTVQLCKLPPRGNGRGYKWPKLEELYIHLTGETPTLALHDAMNDVNVMRTCVQLLADRQLAGLAH